MANIALQPPSSPLAAPGRLVGTLARAGLALAGRAVDAVAPSAPPSMRHLPIDRRA